MDLVKFYENVESSKELRGASVDMDKRIIGIEYIPSKVCTMLPVDAIIKVEWNVLKDILMLRRDPSVLFYMTRIVGYYSRTENWSDSKIGELHDRQKGNYMIKDEVSDEVQLVPSV